MTMAESLPAVEHLPFPLFVAANDGHVRYANEAWRGLGGIEGRLWTHPFAAVETETGDAWLKDGFGTLPNTLNVMRAHRGGVRWYRIACQAALDAQGEDIGVLGTAIDITAQRRAEADAEAVLDTAVDAIVGIDSVGRITRFNQAAERMFGYAEAELLGEPVDRLMPEPYRTEHSAFVKRYQETGNKKIIGIGRELEAISRSGRLFPVYLAVSEVNVDGQRRFTGIIRDLTERHAAEEEAREQRERLAHVGRLSTMGEMTASIAHEINQPLTAIAMYAQSCLKLLDRNEVDTDRLGAAVIKLNQQSLRAGEVIERIQRFVLNQDSHRESASVNGLLSDLLKLAGSDARMHGIELRFEPSRSLPEVFCDPIQIQQVALNLIRNAIDAMAEIDCRYGNRVTLRTRQTVESRVEVSVSDLGPGVASDQAPRMFTAFHTTKSDGMGMGLSICRTIIEGHGGTLDFRNQKTGATFFFTLPTGTTVSESTDE
jgi:two-component system sensor kinase FixL